MERGDLVAMVLVAALLGSGAITGVWTYAIVAPVTLAFVWNLHRSLEVPAAVRAALAWSRAGVAALFVGLQGIVTVQKLGAHLDVPGAHFVVAGVFFVAMAAMMPRVPRNEVFGIRTGYTQRSELAWRSTHRVGALSLAALGAAVAVAGAFHWVAGLLVLVIGNLANLVFVVGYSKRAWEADPAREPLG